MADTIEQGTSFSTIYECFLSKITDDMYMELTRTDTEKMLHELLYSAIPYFEFPRQNITDYNDELQEFNVELTQEEINILAVYMITVWIDQQLASVENTRMKYSGSDFKFTSQANHLQKLLALKKDYERLGFHLQRLYKRHIQDANGVLRSTIKTIMEPPKYDIEV